MAPKPRPWFRFYTETIHDRKIRRLKVEYRWLWVCVLALARQSPQPGFLLISEGDPCGPDDIADAAALPVRTVKNGIEALVEAGLLERKSVVSPSLLAPKSLALCVVNWDKRQYEGDNSTERSRRSRAKSVDGSNDDATLHERPMQRPPSVTENREQRTETERVSTSSSSKSVATPAVPAPAAADEQTIRKTAYLVGRAAVPPTAANPDAYAAGTTRAILTGPDPTDRDRIRQALTDGATPEAIAAMWRPTTVDVARQTTPAPAARPACPACDSAGVLLDAEAVAHRCPVCNGGTRTDLIPAPTLTAVP